MLYPSQIGALKRSCTFSFGSVCFGSLVIAILRSIRFLLPRRGSSYGGTFSLCLVNCVERLMEYMNHYAFTFIAIYGYPFRRAGKEVWQLLQEVGVMPVCLAAFYPAASPMRARQNCFCLPTGCVVSF
eukprot:SAG31_NODE_17856_length_655_cov_1.456835_1_plen_127_part_10